MISSRDISNFHGIGAIMLKALCVYVCVLVPATQCVAKTYFTFLGSEDISGPDFFKGLLWLRLCLIGEVEIGFRVEVRVHG